MTKEARITRHTAIEIATIAASGNLSDAIDCRYFAYLTVIMPAAWTNAEVGFKVSTTKTGTFVPLYDEAGALVEIASPAVDQAHAAPAETAGQRYIKLWSENGAGVNVAQDAERSFTIILKA